MSESSWFIGSRNLHKRKNCVSGINTCYPSGPVSSVPPSSCCDSVNNASHGWLSTSHMLHTLQTLSHLMLSTALRGECYYLHFIIGAQVGFQVSGVCLSDSSVQPLCSLPPSVDPACGPVSGSQTSPHSCRSP